MSKINDLDKPNKHFFSADATALYTNLNIQGCIDSVIEMLDEFQEEE